MHHSNFLAAAASSLALLVLCIPIDGASVKIPKLKWSQRKGSLTIYVSMYEVKQPYVAFASDKVILSGKSGEKDYELTLEFNKPINAAKSKYSVDKSGIALKIKKQAHEEYWPRLTKSKPVGELKRAIEVDWANWIDEEDAPETEEDEDLDESGVEVLTQQKFDDFIGKHDIALLDFYAPWCGHCKSLRPEFAAAGLWLKDHTSVRLGKVDCDQEVALCRAQNVKEYPTLFVYRKGHQVPFKGMRTDQGIKQYMIAQTQKSIKILQNQSDVSAYVKREHSDVVVGYFFENSTNLDKYIVMAEQLRDEYNFALITGDKSVVAYDEVLLFKKAAPKRPLSYTAESEGKDKRLLERKALQAWLTEKKAKPKPDLGSEPKTLEQIHTDKSKPVMYCFVDFKDTETTKPVLHACSQLAEELSGKLEVVNADGTIETQRMEDMALNTEILPQVAIDSPDRSYHYVYETDAFADHKASMKGLTKDLLRAFYGDYKTGKAKKSIKSQPIPSFNDGLVKVVVGHTFEEIVMNQDKDVLIQFYAPWCGFCKSFAPKYTQVAEKVSASKHLTIAKMDAVSNDIPNSDIHVSGYPELYFRRAGEKKFAHVQIEREVRTLVKYLKQQSRHPVKTMFE